MDSWRDILARHSQIYPDFDEQEKDSVEIDPLAVQNVDKLINPNMSEGEPASLPNMSVGQPAQVSTSEAPPVPTVEPQPFVSQTDPNIRDPFQRPDLGTAPTAPVASKPAMPSKDSPIADKLSYIEQLQMAQDQRDKNKLMAGLLRASTQLGGAIADTKPDYNMVDFLEKTASMPVTKFNEQLQAKKSEKQLKAMEDEEKIRMAKMDKNHPAAKRFRDQLAKMGYKIPGNPSVAELEALTGTKLNTLIGYEENRKSAEQAAAMKLMEREQKAKEKAEAQREKMSADEKKELLDVNKRLNGLMRGSVTSKIWTKQQDIQEMVDKINAALSKDYVMSEASAADLSSTWSKVLTGGVPAQSLIYKTMEPGLRQQFASAVNYLKSQPTMDYYPKDVLKNMRKQLQIIIDANQTYANNMIKRAITPYAGLYKKYPEERNYFNIANEDIGIKLGDDGIPYVPGKKEESKREFKADQEIKIQTFMKNNPKIKTRKQAVEILKKAGKI